MAFTDTQRRELTAKLRFRHVKTREANGTKLSYLEGWHVIAEANRIFGFENWDRKTFQPRCLWRETQRGTTSCFYSAKVRIAVRAGDQIVLREGIGTGFGRNVASELAHEIAMKAAETDATKRALATFGNPFGLALYDKLQARVTRPAGGGQTAAEPVSSTNGGRSNTGGDQEMAVPPLRERQSQTNELLLTIDGDTERHSSADAFVKACLAALPRLRTVESVYEFWEQNLEALKRLRMMPRGGAAVGTIISALKAKARALIRIQAEVAEPTAPALRAAEGGATSTALAIPKEKRRRDKAHLAFVATQPCVVCGRRPAHAHHIKFAQSLSMALKVSDEFTIPLCITHHDALHRSGDERAWWARNGILDPLKLAARLWAASRGHELPDDGTDDASAPSDPPSPAHDGSSDEAAREEHP